MLTPEQCSSFERDGYVAPLTMCSPSEMAELRAEIEEAVAARPGPHGGDRWSSRHQDCRVVYDVCVDERICGAVAEFLGSAVSVWNSVFMAKEPGDGEVPWHQDRDFQLLDPDIGLAVWLAIDDAGRDNGCLELVPGSHHHVLPHADRTSPVEFDAHVRAGSVAVARAVPIELRAGEFLLFRNKLLHHSPANRSSQRRLGLAIRYTVPGVRVRTDLLFPGHRVYPVLDAGAGLGDPVGEDSR